MHAACARLGLARLPLVQLHHDSHVHLTPPTPPCTTLHNPRYRVRAACTRLGLARLPLVQLHWDDWGARGYVDVALHLADLQRRGLVGAVGVCNWDVPRLLELIDAGVTPVTNQVGPLAVRVALRGALLASGVTGQGSRGAPAAGFGAAG